MMNRISIILLGVLLISASLACDVLAQWNVARYRVERNRVYTTFGLDPAFVTSIGYAHVLTLMQHDFEVNGDAGLVAAHMDTRDFRARLGTQTSLAHWRSVHFTGSATFITRGTQNLIYTALNFGSDFTGTLGLYRRGWFGAGEFGFDKAIITYLRQSSWYRTHYYADAQNGWFLNAGGIFHYGVAGGLTLGRTEVVARLGARRTENFKDVMPPLYGSLGVGLGF